MELDPIYDGMKKLEKRVEQLSKGSIHIDLLDGNCDDDIAYIRISVLRDRSIKNVPLFQATLSKINYILDKGLDNVFAYELNLEGEPWIEYNHDEKGEAIGEILTKELKNYKTSLEALIKLTDPNYSFPKTKPKFNLSVSQLGILLGIIWNSDLIDSNSVLKRQFIEFFSDNFSSFESVDISSKNLQNNTTSVTKAELDSFKSKIWSELERALKDFRILDEYTNKSNKKSQ